MKRNIFRAFPSASALALTAVFASADPVATILSISSAEQSDKTVVTIRYALSGAPAVVTMDFQTNAAHWASVGGTAVSGATGDVWKRIDTDGVHEITWDPGTCWPLENGELRTIRDGNSRVVLEARVPEDAPDYMIVDLQSSTSADERVKYYPDASFIPGGLLGTNLYRTTSLVMRRIHARGIPWTMGEEGETGTASPKDNNHVVTLTNDYYIGVFPVTQMQWATVGTQNNYNWPSYFTNAATRAMRPVERVSFTDIRLFAPRSLANREHNATAAEKAPYQWPAAPHPGSFLGCLRGLTGIDFDLPGEAQWEFACRAGTTIGFWNNGLATSGTSVDANCPGRTIGNTATRTQLPDRDCGTEEGTQIVGSYAPNAWGLYDMHGNVFEWCLDNWEANIGGLGGVINSDRGAPISADGANGGNSQCIVRGGQWQVDALSAMSGIRKSDWPNVRYAASGSSYEISYGLRLVCTAGLK